MPSTKVIYRYSGKNVDLDDEIFAEEMAKTLQMSERTLNRKLKAQGTSYQMLLDDVRQELAVWYLRQTDMSVEMIAERLGYRDTSNFSRTCKRWFGVTPRAIRGG